MNKLYCWWFGHDPDYENQVFDGDPQEYGYHVPCSRCGLWDISYNDLVEGSRHYKTKQFLVYWLFRKWWPNKCAGCGHRFKCDDSEDHIPF